MTSPYRRLKSLEQVEAKIIKNSKGTNITDDIKVVKKDDIAKDDINMEAKAIKREDELSKNTEDKMAPLMKLLKTKVMEMNPQLKKRKRIKDLLGRTRIQ